MRFYNINYFQTFASRMENSEEKILLRIQKVANKIKQLRKDKGFTSFQSFAFEYDINRVQYWRVESGRNITLKTLIKVLDIHDITLEEFFKDL